MSKHSIDSRCGTTSARSEDAFAQHCCMLQHSMSHFLDMLLLLSTSILLIVCLPDLTAMAAEKVLTGFPHPNPTTSYWQLPQQPLAHHHTSLSLPTPVDTGLGLGLHRTSRGTCSTRRRKVRTLFAEIKIQAGRAQHTPSA